ncbi:MAG: hypothetical protein N2645_23570 [Clostridia bacterium]|nr:hypothetical protein [Clostridia bacterium]
MKYYVQPDSTVHENYCFSIKKKNCIKVCNGYCEQVCSQRCDSVFPIKNSS